jgi:hypothetical protein
LAVGGIEIGQLHRFQQGVGRYADRLGSLIEVPLREQSGDRFLFLLAEFYPITRTLTQSVGQPPSASVMFRFRRWIVAGRSCGLARLSVTTGWGSKSGLRGEHGPYN